MKYAVITALALAISVAVPKPAEAQQQSRVANPGWFVLGIAEMKPAVVERDPTNGAVIWIELSETGEVFGVEQYEKLTDCDAAASSIGSDAVDGFPEIRASLTNTGRLIWMRTWCTQKPAAQ